MPPLFFLGVPVAKKKIPLLVKKKKKRKWQTHYSLSDLRLQFMATVKFALITANGTIVGISYFFDSFQ